MRGRGTCGVVAGSWGMSLRRLDPGRGLSFSSLAYIFHGLLTLGAAAVLAHPLDPALLELRERGDGIVAVTLQTPRSTALEALLPESCRAISVPEARITERRAVQRWEVDCGDGSLIGRRVGIEGLRARRTDAVLRIELRDGGLVESVLRPEMPVVTITAPAGPLAVGRIYLELGLQHILGGLDHLLFVLGLVLLVPDLRRLFWTITAFTLGHSVTLALAVLGFVHMPPAPIEVLIALSIVVVATDLARGATRRAVPHRPLPIYLACGFGLLHGLGFAGALAEIGLPPQAIPLALFAFNCGIELGQLMFVAVALSVTHALSKVPIRWPAPLRLAPAYTIGGFAAFWVWQRLLAML